MRRLSFLLIVMLCSFLLRSQEGLQLRYDDTSSLHLVRLNVDAEVIGNFVTITYDMTFFNSFDRVLEGELSFPLGQGQSVSKFAMDVNGTLREAVIVEKEMARRAYESTIRQRIDPGLLEKVAGNNYKARIYPIPSNSKKRIVLTFESELKVSRQGSVLELPMGINETVDELNINITTYGVDGQPKIKSIDFAERFVRIRRGAYKLNIARSDINLSKSLTIAMPSLGNGNIVLGHDDYFYAYCGLKPQQRLKNKPMNITILWDGSYSMRHRQQEEELALLQAYLEYLENVNVELVIFSYRIRERNTYVITDGDSGALREKIRNVVFDGGSSINSILPASSETSEVLLFSDGLSNLGSLAHDSEVPVYIINSVQSADHHGLLQLGTSSGGGYINLMQDNVVVGMESLKHESLLYLGIQDNQGVIDVYPQAQTIVNEDFSIAGRASEHKILKLLFGYHNEVTQVVKVNLDKRDNAEIVLRLWSKKKLEHLELDKEINRDEIIQLAKEAYLITDYTSMLILDRVEDYVRYRIEPPTELVEEYNELIVEQDEIDREAEEILTERKELIEEDCNDLLEWYKDPIPYVKVMPSSSPIESRDTVDRPTSTMMTSRVGYVGIQTDAVSGMTRGRVMDGDGEPLIGASVIVKGTNRGVITDLFGEFSIAAEVGDVIQINYIGFQGVDAEVRSSSQVDVVLYENKNFLEEVVVVGYGVVKNTSAISYSVTEDTETQMLSGRVSGVTVVTNDANTGTSLLVRGYSSVSGQSMLYVIDGEVSSEEEMKLISPDGINDIQVIRSDQATSIYGAMAANGVVIVNTKAGVQSNQEKILENEEKIQSAIALKPWDVDKPYIEMLKGARDDSSAYEKYLEIRKDYVNRPSFFLDVADYFEEEGYRKLAIEVVTIIGELEIDDYELFKAMAYKLEYLGEYQMAVHAYQRVVELRPEDPQSYRDLALALERVGQVKESFELLYRFYTGDMIEKDPEELYSGIEQIVFVELCRLVNKYPDELGLSKKEIKRFPALEVDMRILIDWNHNDTDIDLWVIEPNGEKGYYGNHLTTSGGRLSEDMMDGFGPEEFMIKKAQKGEYKMLVDYYSDNVQKISGPTILKVTCYKNYGTPIETEEIIIIKLGKNEEVFSIGSLNY